ncbi:cytochrome c-type biogenesis protein [Ochrobactrum sp. 19YEA23]|uniref:cytochrome c biogenesis CcdA family protein n=1 Tax=Ochrobactrum sp. 19YEA23 TaxID=3039854 RepID=UPI000DE54003|nr:cytochrome c-type biogenesis protein [Ochrobactrum sp. 19YEA23]
MSLLFAFIAGVVTILSPCVLPLLPVILASTALDGRSRPIGLIIGFAVFFTAITLLLSVFVRQFAVSPDVHRTSAAIIFIVLGIILAVPPLKAAFEMKTSRIIGRFASNGRVASGFGGGFVTGAGLGLAWTPCVGPIMASVITLALNQQSTMASALTAIAFSLGTAIPMGLVVLLGNRVYSRLGFLKRHSASIQQGMGILILLVGLAIWFGFDRTIQAILFQSFPGWDSALTSWEKAAAN